mgnify:CR=1 FL=1
MVAPGIGRDTACAVLAAMLALKPSETFSLRDGRSLVGFGLFGPFATFLLDQGPASLVMALQTVVSRNVDPLQAAVVTVGFFVDLSS